MPVFNGAAVVTAAIQSIQNQAFQDWELVIVDDGSQDNSNQICEVEMRQDPRIRLYKNETNLGLAKTMNRLVSLARGEFIAVQEQDDRSLPGRLEKEARVLASKPGVGIVSGIAAWVDREGKLLAYFPGLLQRGLQYPQDKQAMVRFLYEEQCKVVNAACMIRREVLEQVNGPFDEEARMSIDWQFFIRAAHLTQFWGLEEVLVEMLRDPMHTHLTSLKDIQFAEARRCIEIIYQDYKDDPTSPVNRKLKKKAMLTELILEARHSKHIKGLALFFRAFLLDPRNPKLKEQVNWYRQKAQQKLQRLKGT